MDIKEYIESGIIESYVLGAVSDQERREVECMSKIYPEIEAELRLNQASIESYVKSIQVDVPTGIKDQLMDQIKSIPQDSKLTIVKNENAEVKDDNSSSIVFMRRVAAAAVILVLVTGGVLITQYNSNQNLKAKYAELEINSNSQKAELSDELKGLTATLDEMVLREQIISSKQTKEYQMDGTANQPDARAKVYWNASEKNLLLSSMGLPAPEEGKQYQLWAIAGGVPVDLGVLDKKRVFSKPISVDVNNLQAFAITLEKDGGSETPNLEELYVIVNV